MDGRDDPVGIPPAELSGAVGPPDVTAMRAVRDVFLSDEPLVERARFDSVLHPTSVRVVLADGVDDPDRCRLDVTWYASDAYGFHYVDTDGVNWRFDRHPNPHSPEKHFHEPPDAQPGTAQPSCIEVETPQLVARAVLKLWRRAYETGSFSALNVANDPP